MVVFVVAVTVVEAAIEALSFAVAITSAVVGDMVAVAAVAAVINAAGVDEVVDTGSLDTR